ncbi:MAG: enoyl-CoA hydratase/isomerase family protein [Alphaproteobacteria bacterium]|nr:enoyl-CoA hydratase/isomerase family protein [Alphaproteobacteria bacterium]
MYETILLDHRGGVSTITLNRPPLNIVTPRRMEELHAAFDLLEAREETRCVVLTGSGTRAFCAGADLGDEARHNPAEGREFRDSGRRAVERIETFPKPVVAAIRGWCIGGGTGLAWPCDIRVAAESARFRAGDVYLGIIPTWSIGMVRLVHYIGRNRTLDTLLLGEDITAAQALDLGIVSRVCPDDRFEAEVARIADRLASGAPLAMRAIKEAVRAQYWDNPDRAAVLEERSAQRVLASKDAKEGMTAFKEKRKPTFTGR